LLFTLFIFLNLIFSIEKIYLALMPLNGLISIVLFQFSTKFELEVVDVLSLTFCLFIGATTTAATTTTTT
jgi:hypothetical protein